MPERACICSDHRPVCDCVSPGVELREPPNIYEQLFWFAMTLGTLVALWGIWGHLTNGRWL